MDTIPKTLLPLEREMAIVDIEDALAELNALLAKAFQQKNNVRLAIIPVNDPGAIVTGWMVRGKYTLQAFPIK